MGDIYYEWITGKKEERMTNQQMFIDIFGIDAWQQMIVFCGCAEQFKEYWTSPHKENRWIPVSERLPEDREIILFSTKTGSVFEGRYFDDKTEHQWYSFRDEWFAWNNVVTAWMPLPEPYRGGEGE